MASEEDEEEAPLRHKIAVALSGAFASGALAGFVESLKADFQGKWAGGVIDCTTLTWNDGRHTTINILTPKSFTVLVGDNVVTASLEDDRKLHWSDGNVWEKAIDVDAEKIWSAMVEIDSSIPFEFVWPAVEADILQGLRAVHTTWHAMGWKSQMDLVASLQEEIAAQSVGAIARGLTKADAKRIADALQEVTCLIREDRKGAAAAAIARASASSGSTPDMRAKTEELRERLKKCKDKFTAEMEKPDWSLMMGVVVKQEDIKEMEHSFKNMEDLLNQEAFETISTEDMLEMETFLEVLEKGLRSEAIEPPKDEDDKVWSTMLHLDKDLPFELVWPSVQHGVGIALARCFPEGPAKMGFRSIAEMEASVQKGVGEKGYGPIARGLSKSEADQLVQALAGVVTCTVEVDREGAQAAGGSAVDLSQERDKCRERFNEVREQLGADLPPGLMERVEADLNDLEKFRRVRRDIEFLLHRIETAAKVAPKHQLRVDRDQVLNSVLIPVLRASPGQLRPGRVLVKYLGEDAEDSGGVTRSFLTEMGSLLGDPQFGLFLPALRGHVQLSPLPGFLAPAQAGDVSRNPERWCRFLGRILAMAFMHKCPLGLLLLPSLCKHLLGEEICFEDLSLAPVIGSGWYTSLKNMLAHREPDLVPDSEFLEKIDSAGLKETLDGLDAKMPSRSMLTFESMLTFVEISTNSRDRWESGADIAACLLRGARTEAQRSRVLQASVVLLQGIDLSPKSTTKLKDTLLCGIQRAVMTLSKVVDDLYPSGASSEFAEAIQRVLGSTEQAVECCGQDEDARNISGVWTIFGTSEASRQRYFEWVQVPGSSKFSGQELCQRQERHEGLRTIRAGTISGSTVRWETDGEQFSGIVTDDGLRMIDGCCKSSNGEEVVFEGMLMKSSPFLCLLRPTQAPEAKVWLTAGVESLQQSTGKFYYEVKLGLDVSCPQLGWLTPEFERGEEINEGVGDDAFGWGIDGCRNRFWHDGGNECKWPKAWSGGEVIGLAIDIDAGLMQFAIHGEWVHEVQQTFRVTCDELKADEQQKVDDLLGEGKTKRQVLDAFKKDRRNAVRGFLQSKRTPAGIALYPAVSMAGHFAIRISKDSWEFTPPDNTYMTWGSCEVLHRPPPLDFSASIVVRRQTSGSLERTDSIVPGMEEDELSESNLPAFAKAMAEKTLVTNLQPHLGPMTEEFRKVCGEHALKGITWQVLQERLSGRLMDPPGMIAEWRSRTSYTFCDEHHEVINFWWSFVEERSPSELSKLFEWCTSFASMPTTPWKFRIQVVDSTDRLPTNNQCMTDDQGLGNSGVVEPVLYLANYSSKDALAEKMAWVDWEKGAGTAMTLI